MAMWTNGSYQQAQPPPYSQAVAQFSHNTMRNQQAGNAKISLQYRRANTRARPPQSANFIYQNEAHPSRQPSNLQTSSVSSSQQQARENSCLLNMLKGNTGQHSSPNTQSGNHSLPVTYGFQQDSHQNSAQTLYIQSPTNIARVKTTYPQQDMSAHWNQSVRVHGNQSLRTQTGNMPVQNGLFHNANGKSATSPPYEQVVCIRKGVPAAAHNLQAAYNYNNRQNGSQHGSTTIPSTAVAQSFWNNSVKMNPSSSGQNLHNTSSSQKTLHYSTHNKGSEANSSFNSNPYMGQYETSMILSEAHELKKTQEEMQRCHAIASIEEYLRDFHSAGSQSSPLVQTSSNYAGKQSNQHMQPLTSNVIESYNSNPYQSLPVNSGQFLPKITNSVETAQKSVDVAPQQSSVLNMFYITGDGSGSKGANAFFLKNVGSLGAAQLSQLSNGISPQRNETQSSVAGSHERLEMLSSVKASDGSVLTSPGRTRAVAVVQPLSHDSYQVASKQTCSNTISQSSEGIATDDSVSNPKEVYMSPKQNVQERKEDSSVSLENQNQVSSDKSEIGYSEVSNNGTLVPSLDSAGSDSQQQLCTDDAGSELATDMQVDQHISAQQSLPSEVPVTQNDDKDKSVMPTDPKELIELSSLPTAPWTYTDLTKLIQYIEKAEMTLKHSTKSYSAFEIFNMFYHCNPKATIIKGVYTDLLNDVFKFLRENITSHSVIFSQVKKAFSKQLKNYHVLKDDEDYSELPYKSSWLNINEQLDDIDKEFDFPPSLKYPLHVSDSTPDEVETGNGIPAKIPTEVSKKLLSSTELEPVECEEEKDSPASPSGMESDDSSDPYYSFEIQVLPPEEARVIFEQGQSKLPQSMEKDNQPEKVTNGSVGDDLSKIIDATLSEKEPKNKPVRQIEQVCCISKWIEKMSGSHPDTLSNCDCKSKQSPEDITDKTLDKEEKLCTIQSDGHLHSATDEDNQVNGGENIATPVVTLCWSELCNELSDTIDLTENDDKRHSCYDKEPEDISQKSISRCQSSITLACENKDDLISNETEMFCQMPDFESDSEKALGKLTESSRSDMNETKKLSRSDTEIQPDPAVDNVQHQLESTGNVQSCTSDSSDTEMENLSSSEKEVASLMSDLEEKSGQSQLTYDNESSLATEEITQSVVTGAPQIAGSGETVEKSRKRKRSHDRFFPIFNKPKKSKSLDGDSKCGMFFFNPADSESSASNASNTRTVELVLFGSSSKKKSISVGSRKSHISSPEVVSSAVVRPPKVITVKLSPLKRKSSEIGEYSVKRKIFEKWRRSFPPTKIRCKNKLKTQKCTSASLSERKHKKTETFGPADTEERTVTSKMKILNGETRFCLSLKRRKSLNNEEEGKRITIIPPADQERSQADSGSDAAMPLQSNIVLKFSVLPNTFNFQDGSHGTKKSTHPVPDKPDPVEEKDQSHNTSARTMGTWFPNSEKKYRPLLPPVPKTNSLFNEFQKKYKEKMVPSMDK